MTAPSISADNFVAMMLVIDIFLLTVTLMYTCDIKHSRHPKAMKIVVCIGHILTVTGLVTAITLLETTYKSYINQLNSDTANTFTNCTVYNTIAFVDVPKNTIEYMIYYGSNATVTVYTGTCNSLVQCYPSVNATIGCYKLADSYTVNPTWYSMSNVDNALTVQIILACVYGLLLFAILHLCYTRPAYIRSLQAPRENMDSTTEPAPAEHNVEKNDGVTLLNAATNLSTNLGSNYSTMADLVDRTNLTDLTDRTNLEQTIEVLQRDTLPSRESSDDYE
jgi:hypothetical protein